jgi:cytochrome d ubiquinol oxidase subunit II
MLTGAAVAIGYVLLGATWLVMKTQGPVQERMRRYSVLSGLVTLASIGLVSLLTPFQNPAYYDRWFAWPTMVFSFAVPGLVAIAAWMLFAGLRQQRDVTPFVAALALFVLCFAGIGISFYPHMIPPSLTIWQAAAPDSSLLFTLVGALVLLPIILGYTAYAYWVFKGKVKAGEGYH